MGKKAYTILCFMGGRARPQDQAPRDANQLRMTEAEALTRMEPKRLLKKRARKVGDDEDYEE